jgi:lactate dehydrogenase-like 2-hydroxyacid dehydrogenase
MMVESPKPSLALQVNAGRGDIIDEDSLLEALDRGWLSHAILDVFSVEPLPQVACFLLCACGDCVYATAAWLGTRGLNRG